MTWKQSSASTDIYHEIHSEVALPMKLLPCIRSSFIFTLQMSSNVRTDEVGRRQIQMTENWVCE